MDYPDDKYYDTYDIFIELDTCINGSAVRQKKKGAEYANRAYILYDHLFNWDTDKNLSNIEKHGVPFKEAATVFLDTSAAVIDDEDTYHDEERFNII